MIIKGSFASTALDVSKNPTTLQNNYLQSAKDSIPTSSVQCYWAQENPFLDNYPRLPEYITCVMAHKQDILPVCKSLWLHFLCWSAGRERKSLSVLKTRNKISPFTWQPLPMATFKTQTLQQHGDKEDVGREKPNKKYTKWTKTLLQPILLHYVFCWREGMHTQPVFSIFLRSGPPLKKYRTSKHSPTSC